MEWFIYQVIAGLVGAGNTVLDKKLATRPHADPFLNAASFGVVGLPVAAAGLAVLPPIPWPDALRGLLGGMLFVPAAWLYYKVMEREQAAGVAVMMRLASVETLVLSALLLGEMLTGLQVVIFAVMLGGGLLLTVKPGGAGLGFSKGLCLIPVVTTLLALNSVLLAPLYRHYSLWAGVTWSKAGCVLGTLLVAAAHRDKAGLWSRARGGGGRMWATLVAEQSVRLVTGLLGDVAIVEGVPLALASAVGGVRLSFTLFATALILKERWERQTLPLRILGVGCQVIGSWLIIS